MNDLSQQTEPTKTASTISCFICNEFFQAKPGAKKDIIDCPECGSYKVNGEFLKYFQSLSESDRFLIQHKALRELKQSGDCIAVFSAKWAKKVYKEGKLPSPVIQADTLIKSLGDELLKDWNYAGTVNVSLKRDGYLIGSRKWESLQYIVQELKKDGMLEIATTHCSNGNCGVRMTYQGWKRYERVSRGQVGSAHILVSLKYTNKSIQDFYENYLKPVFENAGYHLERMEQDWEQEVINHGAAMKIKKARMLIVDLTQDKPAEYWQAGLAEGLGKAVIYTCAQNQWQKKRAAFSDAKINAVIWGGSKAEKQQAAEELRDLIGYSFDDSE